MKSYLSLIPNSAKVRKRQNRMTVLCIIISVFLVTAIFSVADMMIRTESDLDVYKRQSFIVIHSVLIKKVVVKLHMR